MSQSPTSTYSATTSAFDFIHSAVERAVEREMSAISFVKKAESNPHYIECHKVAFSSCSEAQLGAKTRRESQKLTSLLTRY